MEDYPRPIAELEARFSSEEECRQYLFHLRWPEGSRCARYDGTKSLACQADALSMFALWPSDIYDCWETIFEGTRKPLTVWFRGIWWVVSNRKGASALGLKRILGLGSYQTPWAWPHKIRRAMVRPQRDRLFGSIEVDETYLVDLGEGIRERQTFKKALIPVAAEEEGEAIG